MYKLKIFKLYAYNSNTQHKIHNSYLHIYISNVGYTLLKEKIAATTIAKTIDKNKLPLPLLPVINTEKTDGNTNKNTDIDNSKINNKAKTNSLNNNNNEKIEGKNKITDSPVDNLIVIDNNEKNKKNKKTENENEIKAINKQVINEKMLDQIKIKVDREIEINLNENQNDIIHTYIDKNLKKELIEEIKAENIAMNKNIEMLNKGKKLSLELLQDQILQNNKFFFDNSLKDEMINKEILKNEIEKLKNDKMREDIVKEDPTWVSWQKMNQFRYLSLLTGVFCLCIH